MRAARIGLLGWLVLAGCSGDSLVLPAGGDPSCSAGQSITCVGPGGCAGGQACRPDGLGLEPCVCGASDGGSSEVSVVDTDVVEDAPAADTDVRGDSTGADAGTDTSTADTSTVDTTTVTTLDATLEDTPDALMTDARVSDDSTVVADTFVVDVRGDASDTTFTEVAGDDCVPKACTDFPGSCGQNPNGCGGLTSDCGGCGLPQTCGGGGIDNVCGGGGCVGWECQQTTCPAGTTSISGTVRDPAGKNPLPNVYVYVPNAPLGSFASGAACEACAHGLQGAPLVTTVTDAFGKFTLRNAPVGAVPLVIQTGKWRRRITVSTTACADTAVVADLTRLPKNTTEGDMPQIALATGGFDPLECLLRKVGIADTEFTNAGGTGRVNLFKGSPPTAVNLGGGGGTIAAATGKYSAALGGATFPVATTLWNSTAELSKYDLVLLACEGDEYGDPANTYLGGRFPGTKSTTALAAMKSYVGGGGRVFASHYHNYWIRRGPGTGTDAFSTLASWNYPSPALLSSAGTVVAFDEKIVTSFPKGSVLANWLKNIGASTTLGVITVKEPKNSVNAIDTTRVREWIYAENGRDSTGKTYPHSTQYMSFATPLSVPVASRCGRFVFSDIHVSSGDSPGKDFPSGCTTNTMTPQELALEYMLFDLAAPVCDESVVVPAAPGCGGLNSCAP